MTTLIRPEWRELLEKARVVIEAVRAVGARGHWDAPHWTLHVPHREANALFDLAYELDPELEALLAAASVEPSEDDAHDKHTVSTVAWLRGMGYIDAANAIAELHVEDRALRGLPGLVFHDGYGKVPASVEEPQEAKTQRVFQAVVYAYEGREVPTDLLNHGMVRRAMKFLAGLPPTYQGPLPTPAAEPPTQERTDERNSASAKAGHRPIGEAVGSDSRGTSHVQPVQVAARWDVNRVSEELDRPGYGIIRGWLAIHGGTSALIVREELAQLANSAVAEALSGTAQEPK